ncbi:FAD-dependent oxidoreductase [Dietzia sp.]|uniref:FAD-dependent oxidoreductase n=1 Tax=Dietzia sp. TaxID=1871616 RepID=UPI002FDB3A6D
MDTGARAGQRAVGDAGASAGADAGVVDSANAGGGGRSVAVIGGSVIGLAIAFRAAGEGYSVTVFDPDGAGPGGVPSAAAAWVAGGMLAPFSEAWPGEPEALELGTEALAAWPALLDELAPFEDREGGGRAEAGAPSNTAADDPWTFGPVRTSTGCLLLACDEGDSRDVGLALDWAMDVTGRARVSDAPTADPAEAGDGTDVDPVRRITRRAARELVPGLTGAIRSAYFLPGEGSIDNRRLLGALRRGAIARGVRFVPRRIEDLAELTDPATEAPFEAIVVAAGEGSTRLLDLPIRNVKGEVLRLFERPGCEPAPRHVVRAQVRGRPIYMVPRDGGLVIGATQYEHGDDRQVTVAGIRDLLADAETIFPGIGEFELREAIAGLRPMSADNLPYLGPVPPQLIRGRAPERNDSAAARSGSPQPLILAATGHGRNGVALSSVTSAVILAYLEGGRDADVSAAAAAARPDRVFAEGSAHD